MRALDLSFCQLPFCAINKPIKSALINSPGFLRGSGVRVINLSGNDLGDSGATTLASLLSQAGWRELDVSNCCITADGATQLFEQAATTLQQLKLDDNPIGNDGARALARALGLPGCTLERVGIANCRVTDVGVKAIGQALALTQAAVRLVDIEFNSITNEGRAVLQVHMNGLFIYLCVFFWIMPLWLS